MQFCGEHVHLQCSLCEDRHFVSAKEQQREHLRRHSGTVEDHSGRRHALGELTLTQEPNVAFRYVPDRAPWSTFRKHRL